MRPRLSKKPESTNLGILKAEPPLSERCACHDSALTSLTLYKASTCISLIVTKKVRWTVFEEGTLFRERPLGGRGRTPTPTFQATQWLGRMLNVYDYEYILKVSVRISCGCYPPLQALKSLTKLLPILPGSYFGVYETAPIV